MFRRGLGPGVLSMRAAEAERWYFRLGFPSASPLWTGVLGAGFPEKGRQRVSKGSALTGKEQGRRNPGGRLRTDSAPRIAGEERRSSCWPGAWLPPDPCRPNGSVGQIPVGQGTEREELVGGEDDLLDGGGGVGGGGGAGAGGAVAEGEDGVEPEPGAGQRLEADEEDAAALLVLHHCQTQRR